VDAVKGTPPVVAAAHWIGHLFEPGYNEFLLTMITAVPFLALAVFAVFHTTTENASARVAGIAGALALGGALLIWTQVSIRTSRSSTAAIGYLFIPFGVALVMPFGYLAGRLFRRWTT
jgi:hypothetical protein